MSPMSVTTMPDPSAQENIYNCFILGEKIKYSSQSCYSLGSLLTLFGKLFHSRAKSSLSE